jgi:3-oxoacyl-[acyl-carrier protein] reductase
MNNMNKVLITGGNKGIGLAIVKKYLKNNYDVYTTYNDDITFKRLDGVNYYQLNLASKESIDSLVRILPNIDILINNAGICDDDDIKNKTYESMHKVIDVDLTNTLYLTKEIINNKLLKGNIVFIGSDNALSENYPESIEYDAAKAGLIKVCEDLAIYLAPNVRVNMVAPGWVNTDMNSNMDLGYKKEVLRKLLLNRFADPEEVANVVYFITSNEASYVNAAIIPVNGGLK